MVRKWSYLNVQTKQLLNSGDNLIFPDFRDKPVTGLKKRHIFKVFRNTTRFKRWTVGITKVVRKKYIRRKHLTNFMNLNYITNSWVSFYLKQRNLTRFYQGLHSINNQFTSTEHNIVLKKALNDLDKSRFGILSLSTSTNLQQHLVNNSIGFKSLLNKSPILSNNKLLIYDSENDRSTTPELFSGTRELDSFQTTPSIKSPEHVNYLQPINSYSFNICVSVYKIIYTLSLLNSLK